MPARYRLPPRQRVTPHRPRRVEFAVAHGIMNASRDSGVPVLFGVLTCENERQAWDRAGGRVGNKGKEAAEAALEMVNVYRSLAN